MEKYDDTNRGVLFKNDKGDNPNRPDYTGKINVGGTEYRLSAWIKDSQSGKKFMSLAVSELEQKAEPVQEVPQVDDEIPFNEDR
jgi:uncharacterized protein (DUF736 family)